MKRRLVAFGAALLMIFAMVGLAGSASATVCTPVSWGSLDKSGGVGSTAPIFTSRVGVQTCYDSFVVEVDGPASGYSVGYRDEVYSEGEGAALSPYLPAHGARLQVIIRDPAYNVNTGVSTYPYQAKQLVHSAPAYPQGSNPTLRGVVYGGSFEGQSTFAVGLRARLPFQVLVLAGPGDNTRFVINVRHQWGEF